LPSPATRARPSACRKPSERRGRIVSWGLGKVHPSPRAARGVASPSPRKERGCWQQ
jgi:hypothetical protein